MLDHTLTGGFSSPATQSAAAFRAALSAMARPGRIERIEGAVAPAPCSCAAATLLLTLCDAETPLYLAGGHDNAALRDWIAFHIGAPVTPPGQAMFALGAWDALPVKDFPVGTAEYPDRSTTVIVEMPKIAAAGAVLTGPGIKHQAQLSLPEINSFQANRDLFPLGLDFYFTSGNALAALPRSTRVEG